MKKYLLASLMLMAMTLSAAAYNWTNVVWMTVTNNNGDTYTLKVGEASDLPDQELTPGYYAEVVTMDAPVVYPYITFNGKNYSTLYMKSLENTDINIKVDENTTSLTITFDVKYGEFTFFDKEGQPITVTKENQASMTQNIVVDQNDLVGGVLKGRFKGFYKTAAPQICHQNGKLEITGYNGWSVQVLTYTNKNEAKAAVAITSDYQEIDLDVKKFTSTDKEGQYRVVMTKEGEDTKELVIKVVE